MTYNILRVDEIGYEETLISFDGNDIVLNVDDYESPALSKEIRIPKSDWPKVKDFIENQIIKQNP